MPPVGYTPHEKDLFTFLNDGETPGEKGDAEFRHISQMEHNLRNRIPEAAPEVPMPEVISQPQKPETPLSPRTYIPPDRFHKYGELYRTVSNPHSATPDPGGVIDPASDETISAGYANLKTMIAAYYAKFPSLIGIARGALIVHGGYYDEQCVFDSPYIDVYGIGDPIIARSVFSDGDTVVDITGACTKIIFDGFDIMNVATEVKTCWGLRIREGIESGSIHSDIQIKNCDFSGNEAEIYSERWSYFFNCNSRAITNVTGLPSVRWRIGGTETIGATPTKWSDWVGGSISGYDSGDPVNWGLAFQIIAKRADLTTWVPNSYTVGLNTDYTDTDNAEPWNEPWKAQTGVRISHADIFGWAENYGWCLECFEDAIIGGRFINDTGSGAIHLHTHCRTNIGGDKPDIYSFSWFTIGVGKVNYLVNYQDDGNFGAPVALNIIWISDFKHSAPVGPYPGGSVVFNQFGNAGANPDVFVTGSSHSSKQFWLNAIAPAYAGPATALNVPRFAMKEGYQNV